MTVFAFIATASEGLLQRIIRWLTWFDARQIGEGDQVQFRFLGMPQGWGLFLTIVCLAGLIWLTFWLYRREGRTASRRRRYLLAGLRTTAILLALLMFLEPTLVVSTIHKTLSPVLVLLDVSKSMTLADRYGDVDAEQETVDNPSPYGPAEDGRIASPQARQVIDATGWYPEDVRNQSVPRLDIMDAVLSNEDIDLLNRLAEANPVYIYAFARSVNEVLHLPLRPPDQDEDQDGERVPGFHPGMLRHAFHVQPEEPFYNRTHLGQAVKALLDDHAGRPVASMLVLTDGQDNDEVVDRVRLAGEAAAARDVPIYGTLIGIDRLRRTRNIRADEMLDVNRTLFVGDPAQVVARVASTGYELPKEVTADLYRQKVGERTEELLETKEFVVEPRKANQPLSFMHVPEAGDEGEYIFTVKVRPLPDEHFTRDNIAVASGIRVVEDTTNVLLVSGAPSWEYRALRNLLIQDDSVALWCWLQSATREYPQMGNHLLRDLPTDFGPDPTGTSGPEDGFHVVILMDIDPTRPGMRREWFEGIRNFVEDDAGGLLYVAGEKYTTDFFRTNISDPISRVIPVELDIDQARVEQGSFRWQRRNRLSPTTDGVDSPLLKFSIEPEQNRQIWRRLPGHYWSFPIRRIRGAGTPYIRTDDPRRTIDPHGGSAQPMPVLVQGYYGRGRVAFMAFDETWRWRQLGEQVHDTFWTQLVRSLVEGQMLGTRSFARLQTDGEQFDVGSPVTVSAHVQYPEGRADQLPPEVRVELRRVGDDPAAVDEPPEVIDSRTIQLQPRFEMPADGEPGTLEEGKPAEYQARFTPEGAGYYQLSVIDDPAGGSAATAFIQVAGDPEFRRLRANMARLEELTEASSGGAVVALNELRELPDQIEDRSEEAVIPGGEFSLWANPLVLGLMALLLGAEWWLRKRANMA